MRTNGPQYNTNKNNNKVAPRPPLYTLPPAPISSAQNNIHSSQPLTTNHNRFNEPPQNIEMDNIHNTEPTIPEDEGNVKVVHSDCDGIADDELFEGSTHHFAIYFAEKRNVSGLIISYFVFSLQMALYSICAHQVMGDLSGDQFMIPVQVRYGKDCKVSKNLVCPPDLPNLSYVAFAAVLLSFFLMHDIVAGIRVMTTIPGRWAKFAGFIIVFEALFAALIGALFAVGADSGYDAIANCIGVLFIHDADEKAFEAFQVINAEQLKSSKCCKNKCCDSKVVSKICSYTRLAALFVAAFSIMVFSLMVAASIRAAQKQQIKDVYGDDSPYANSGWFGDYDYDWYWYGNYTR